MNKNRLNRLKKVVKELLFEEWMTDFDWMLIESGIDYGLLNNEIEVGISNGYTEDQQFEIIAQLITKLK